MSSLNKLKATQQPVIGPEAIFTKGPQLFACERELQIYTDRVLPLVFILD